MEPLALKHDLCNLLRAQGTVLVRMEDGARRHEEAVVKIVLLDSSLHFGGREPNIEGDELARVATVVYGVGGVRLRDRGGVVGASFGARVVMMRGRGEEWGRREEGGWSEGAGGEGERYRVWRGRGGGDGDVERGGGDGARSATPAHRLVRRGRGTGRVEMSRRADDRVRPSASKVGGGRRLRLRLSGNGPLSLSLSRSSVRRTLGRTLSRVWGSINQWRHARARPETKGRAGVGAGRSVAWVGQGLGGVRWGSVRLGSTNEGRIRTTR